MTAERTVDTPITVEFDGQKYKLRQITNQDYGELTRYLKTLYIGEVGKSMKIAGVNEDKIITEIGRLQFEEWGIKGNNQKEIQKHYKERVQPLMSSTEAMAYILYVGLRKEHPELSLEEANNIVASSPQDIGDLVTYVMGGIKEKTKDKTSKNVTRAKT